MNVKKSDISRGYSIKKRRASSKHRKEIVFENDPAQDKRGKPYGNTNGSREEKYVVDIQAEYFIYHSRQINFTRRKQQPEVFIGDFSADDPEWIVEILGQVTGRQKISVSQQGVRKENRQE